MKRVLVTGATGFIGKHCLQPLQSLGCEVHATHCSTALHGPPGVIWHRTDLLDPMQSRQLARKVSATHLLHLAWCTEPGQFWNAPANEDWRRASLGLAEAFLSAGGKRMVVAGSCAEYVWDGAVCSELTTPLRPNSGYGRQKAALMAGLNDLCTRFGAELAWARVFNLYGPGEHKDRLVAASIRAMLAGQPANCTHGEQLRDYLYCVDAAEAFVALLMCDTLGAVNIASGAAIRIRDLVEAAADAIGRRDLVRLGALPAPENEPAVLIADVQRLNAEVHWRPRVDLADGIRQSIRFWRSAGSPC